MTYDAAHADVGAELPPTTGPATARLALLAVVLVLAVIVAGSPDLDAPWVQGDEFEFIVLNPDVNPAADPVGSSPLGTRLARLFTKVHHDLYQPIPILTYALEWHLTAGDPASFRRTDLLLHALNALLVWWVLAGLLPREHSAPTARRTLAWGLALLWALHPMLVNAYAADMGRTHLLSATGSLLACGLYLQAVRRNHAGFAAGALLALLAAMLCKALPGWVLFAIVAEAAQHGWRGVFRTWRPYAVAALCATFGVVTLATSSASGVMQDASLGLFGDPITRSALAVWLYFRNLVAPFWLSFWYIPDPRTGWGYPLVWLGLALTAASVLHAWHAWHRPTTRPAAVGWTWMWALLLPVIGLVGAREVAAVDRYFYQPLMGVLLVVGTLAARFLATRRVSAPLGVVMAVVGVLGITMILWDLPNCRIVRSTLRRAERLVELNAGDPRAYEALAAAYDYARDKPLPAHEQQALAPGESAFVHFTRQMHGALRAAAAVPDLPDYFPGPDDRAPFHRRLSYRFLNTGDATAALAQAQLAQTLEPDNFSTWKRLAAAQRALGRRDEAVAAYTEAEKRLPPEPMTRLVHYADFGTFLLFDLRYDQEACPRLALALEEPRPNTLAEPRTWHRARRQAQLGYALCLIRYGEGREGFALTREVIQAEPHNTRAWLVVAEYHLRSHHWTEAAAAYGAIIHEHPTHYEALRGFHEVCLQLGRPSDAAAAWREAAERAPENREFDSFRVWSLALAGDPTATTAARDLLQRDPNNPFACLAMMITDVRAGDAAAAVSWVQRAATGRPADEAREFPRAEATLRLRTASGDLPPEGELARIAVLTYGGFGADTRAGARGALDAFVEKNPGYRTSELVTALRRELSDEKPSP